MNSYVWYVLTREKDGKRYAHAFRLRSNYNIASFVKDYPDIEWMNSCPTKKFAESLAQAWNDSFKNNGTYMFSDGPAF